MVGISEVIREKNLASGGSYTIHIILKGRNEIISGEVIDTYKDCVVLRNEKGTCIIALNAIERFAEDKSVLSI